jgi:hypothetical protein
MEKKSLDSADETRSFDKGILLDHGRSPPDTNSNAANAAIVPANVAKMRISSAFISLQC